jgi:hypothetical protein
VHMGVDDHLGSPPALDGSLTVLAGILASVTIRLPAIGGIFGAWLSAGALGSTKGEDCYAL